MAEFKRQLVIAICSCGARFYDTDEGIDRMNNHVNEGNYEVHRWVCVPDITMNAPLGRTRDVV